MSECNTIQAYLDAVAEQIRWKRAKPVVLAELEQHLEDQRDTFASEAVPMPSSWRWRRWEIPYLWVRSWTAFTGPSPSGGC